MTFSAIMPTPPHHGSSSVGLYPTAQHSIKGPAWARRGTPFPKARPRSEDTVQAILMETRGSCGRSDNQKSTIASDSIPLGIDWENQSGRSGFARLGVINGREGQKASRRVVECLRFHVRASHAEAVSAFSSSCSSISQRMRSVSASCLSSAYRP